MSPEPPGRTESESRADARRWLETWKHAGPILDQERWDRVAALTDDDARRDAIQLWELWRPDWPTDDGEGLLLQQRVFARARRQA